MKEKLISSKTLSIFDYFLIIGITAFNIAYSIITKEIDIIGTIASITGVICVVLVAKGNIFNYAFGAVNVALYAYIAYINHLYGDAILNALYYFPMQFVGWFSWINNRQKKDTTKVKARALSKKERLVWFIIATVTTIIVGYILDLLNDPQPYKDSATTVLSVIAMYFMVKRYMEQWVIWIVVNTISVVIWSIATINGNDHAILMIFMWAFYLLNSMNGLDTWIRLISATNREEKAHEESPQ